MKDGEKNDKETGMDSIDGSLVDQIANDYWKWNNEWDKHKGYNSPKYVRTIYLIRHGHFIRKLGNYNDSLSLKGVRQVNLLGKRLATMNINFTNIYTSPFKRAKHTARIINKYLPDKRVKVTDFLREGRPVFPDPAPAYWRKDDKEIVEDGPRLWKSFKVLFHRSQSKKDINDIFVCHGNIIGFLILRSLQLPSQRWLQLPVGHASITRIEIDYNGEVFVKSIGDIGHLPQVITSG
ncbi:DgyrCDS10624 [Dimorphilus gyrociliatus]|uniref:Serine/threonine-protein phosphatase PGAM5, mitochondrial n=1 Tax=Dimorphilus gyrociliatus TaxID=2664684 RepID=A0A7I8W1Z7_9ANNE|nr:DgyrCDS10624 [Dimorphilus gyrociliatus]